MSRRREIEPSKPLVVALSVLLGEVLVLGGMTLAHRLNDWLSK